MACEVLGFTPVSVFSRLREHRVEPLVTGFLRVPYCDIAAIRQIADTNANAVAVLMEPVQGEGGIRAAPAEFMRELRALCDAKQWLLMFDEVQCGIGRTGRWFAHQHAGIVPDVMTLAKGLGSGVPIGACLTAGRAAGLFAPGNHGSTFGGNPLACRAGLATLDIVESSGLLARAESLGARIRDGLSASLAGVPGVREVRGHGLMIGVELDRACAAIVTLALARGLLVNVTAERVVRLLPPLVMSDAEGDRVVALLCDVVREFLGTAP